MRRLILCFPEDLARDAPHVRQGEFFFHPSGVETKELSRVEPLYEWGWYDYNVQHAYQTRFATKELADKHLRRHMESWGKIEDSSGRMVHRFPIKDQNNLAQYPECRNRSCAHSNRNQTKRWRYLCQGNNSAP